MYISIDAGGTNTRVAGATELGNPTFAGEPLRRKNTHDFENDLHFMVSAALQIADGEPIEAVGIGTPGSPNEDKTEIKSAKNLSSWVNKPLVTSLSEGLSCPVFYDNDVTAVGLGEAYYGQTKGNFDYIIWGTGIGGGTIRYEDTQPNVSVLNWRKHFGEWESDNGGAELAKTFGKPPEDFTIQEWEVVAETFKKHLQRYLETYRPQAIVFGGGLAVKHTQMLTVAGTALGTKIAVTEFGDDSGLMGGFGLIKRNLNS